MSYKITKGIEVPVRRSGRKSVYPWHDMEVDDSFETDDGNVRSAASSHGRRYGQKFTVHKMGNGKFRVWRVK